MSSPAPQWVVLPRFPGTDIDDSAQDDAGISIALNAPPHIAQLVVPRSIVAGGSCVLAADPSGFLLFSGSGVAGPLAADKAAGTSYYIWDAVLKTCSSVPAPETPVSGAGTAGLIAFRGAFGHHNLMVAELVLSTGATGATMRCFSTNTGKWSQRSLRAPSMNFPWSIAHVLHHQGKLWWIDLLLGLLAFHPSAEEPELHFVPLPNCYRILTGSEQGLRKGLSNDRCVNLSRGKLRLVVLTRQTSMPKIKLWTLVDHEAGKWMLNYEVPIEDIWADQSYETIGLPKERPTLALVHPNKPCVVYFLLKGYLFGVDLLAKEVTESASIGRYDVESAGSPFLSWELPPSLITALSDPSPAAESRFTSAFDSIADIFCDAYARELDYLAFHQFAKIALSSLNRKNKKTEENKFKLSERLFLQYFLEDLEVGNKKYAHLNFYAESGSEKVLVFAELHTDAHALDDVDPDDWILSSCKLLTRNYHGGMYGTGQEVGQSNVTRKRKKSLYYCIVCPPEMLHPTCGFKGGCVVSAS
ncbi:hypothetical protein EJB05_16203 [Eragrostis curvula]|uniref:DUF1618 domain-containing protein n=1 Tax=Eragrostis curvula TaxID=38414 RepID=A0A5J9VG02_9POAL|nr:hypothetical protein EJB05_16203 [Eragrostis curvula]